MNTMHPYKFVAQCLSLEHDEIDFFTYRVVICFYVFSSRITSDKPEIRGGGHGLHPRRGVHVHTDHELQLLSQSLPYVIQNGVANSTYEKYSRAWEKWLTWSANKNLTGRPADPYDVALYFNHVLFVSNRQGAITAAFYGVRWGHHVAGLYSPTDNPLTKLAYEGALRLSSKETRRKDPIPVETIREVASRFSSNENLMDLRFATVCLLGFAVFFRIEELLATKLKHVSIFPDHMQVFLPDSKTDQHREGEMVVISRTSSQFCPVSHVEIFLKQAKLDPMNDKEAYLIPRLHKTKKGHNASKTTGISYTTMREVFKENIESLQKNNEKYGLHSLRSGGASSAANHGVPDRLISKQGRWKSDKARNGYIKDDQKTRMSVSLYR